MNYFYFGKNFFGKSCVSENKFLRWVVQIGFVKVFDPSDFSKIRYVTL